MVEADRATTRDRSLTIGLLVIQFVVSLLLAMVSFLSLLQVGQCGTNTCNVGAANMALFITPASALVALVVCLVVAANRMAQRQRAWWVPVVGTGIVVLTFVLELFVVAVALRVWQ